MDSNGSIDTETEDWTSTEESNAINEIYDGLDWWTDNAADNTNISWFYDINYGVPTSYEPITRPYTDEQHWIQEAMQAFGYTAYPGYKDNVRDYLNDLRDSYGTDWAFAIFLVDSSADADGLMSDNYFAYAWLTGPHTVMTYDNDGYGISNMDAVTAHEVGHIFGALDQYASSFCYCTQTGGYLNIENQNCDNSCDSDVASIMRSQVAPFTNNAIDDYAKGQLGWRDTDSDGVLDPIEQSDSTNPALAAIEYHSCYKYGSYVSGTLWARSLASDAYSGIDVNSCKYGLNSVRVFVQYIVYEADADGLIGRMEQFLEIAHKHEISVMFVLLDDCFKGEPKLGKQPDPVPGVHNSQWTSSPGNRRKARKYRPALEKYVKHVVGHFGKDKRVIVWDLYNEPKKHSRPLVEAAFTWARSVNPSQPLTTCWQANDLWDVASFHEYGPPNAGRLARRVRERPAICTECIARTRNSRFETVLPAFARQRIGWYMWGLVKGRIQTHYPWGSPKGAPEPKLWFHDLLHPDGKPYRPGEIEYIRRFGDEFRKAKPKPKP